ncbi:MAG: hypothetical protein K0B81_02730 [Candidatus Cloacimonetes bacterium]|nr:hypothetical protein [Candidatus Cloacimonadota bacterium]
MYNFKTLILGTDPEKLASVGEYLSETYQDEVFMTAIRIELEEYLSQQKPDILLVDISSQMNASEKKNILESVKMIKAQCPECVILAFGGKKTTIKDKDFQEAVNIFSGKLLTKITKDYESLRSLAIVKGNKMIGILTVFFAPYLTGNYEIPGFDRLLAETHSREENLEVIEQLETNFGLFSPLLQENNRELIESALSIYRERNLKPEEIEKIQEAFFFQFTTLTAMENFIDRRRYYAEKQVIEDVWESTISFAREIENSIIFGCHKLGDVIHLKITVPTTFELKKLTPRSKFYKTIESIEPYGVMIIRSGDQTLCIGCNEQNEEIESVEGTVFLIRIKVVVPTRGRRGLKRL